MSAQGYNKAPPAFVKDADYEQWKKKMEMWQIVTSIEVKKQGAALYLVLDSDSQAALSQLTTAQINCDDGVKNIIKVLDGLYLKDKIQRATEALESFFGYERDGKMTITEYINEFDKRYGKMKAYNNTVSDECLGFRLLKQAKLSMADEKLIKSHGTMAYENVKTQLKKVMSLEDSSSHSNTPIKEEIKVESDLTLYTNPTRGQNWGQRFPRYQRAFRGVNRGSQAVRGRGYSQMRGSNPTDQYGNITTCIACGSRYHWLDKCPEKKEHATYYEDSRDIDENCQEFYDGEREETYYNVTLFQSDYDSPKNIKSLVHESFNCAVIDCGASKTVCGQIWLNSFLDSLDTVMKNKVEYAPSMNMFKFGDGRSVRSTGFAYIPAVIGKCKAFIKADVVSEDIPLLLSKCSLKRANAEMNFFEDTIRILGQKLKMYETASGHYVLPITEGRAVLHKIDQNEEVTITLVCKTELTSEQKALKLHRQFAHPSAERLLKLVKAAGNGDKVLENEIKEVSRKCKICKVYKKAPSRPVVGMSLGSDFNDCVAMDLKQYQNIYLLHVIDHVTRLSACAPIRDKKPETIIRELFRIWIGIYGCPKRFISDNGGEFSNEKFRSLCEQLNVNVHTTAAEAPWSNGLCERHNAVIGDMVTKVREDTGCSVDMAVAWSINAKNSLANMHGFSPYQLVFGKNPNLPNFLHDKPPALGGKSTVEIIRNNLNALHKAREAFIECESSERLKRALNHNVRSSGDIKYVTGDIVYYKRLNEPRWKGPATVLGQDGQQVLVKNGGVYVRVHPCRLRLERKSKSGIRVTDDVSQGSSSENEDEQTEKQSKKVKKQSTQGNLNSEDEDTYHDASTGDAEAEIRVNDQEENHTTEQTPVVTSLVPKLKSKMRIDFKTSEGDEWKRVELVTRSGKVTGKYPNSWNVVGQNGEKRSVDLDRDVVEWKVCEDVEDLETEELVAENTPTEINYLEIVVS